MRQRLLAVIALSRLQRVACAAAAAGVTVVVVVLLFGLGGHQVVRVVADLSEVVFAATAAVSAGWRARTSSGRLRRSLAALAAGCAAWAIGQAIWSWFELVLGRATPFPSIADVGYLLFPVGASVALWLYPVSRSQAARRRSVLDSLTVTAALALVSWTTVLGAVAHAASDSSLAFVVSLSYPVLDLVVLSLLCIVLSHATGSRETLALLAFGVMAIAVADSSFTYLTATGDYATGATADLGWVVGFAVLTVAPFLSATPVPDATRIRPLEAPSKLPYVPVLVATAAVSVEMYLGRKIDVVEATLAAVTVVLVLVRQYLMVRENSRLVTTLSEREQQLHHQAFHDGLTGLANRALFQDRVAHALDLHQRDRRGLAVLFCDLDDFKLVNDTLGHAAGDELLVRVAERLRGALRAGDTLARLGGDEFAILIEDGGDPRILARQIIAATHASYAVGGRQVDVQASVGLTIVASDVATPTASDLLMQADTAMYAAKRTGKGGFRAFEPGMELTEVTDEGLRLRLSSAITERQISLEYQPITDLATGTVVGFEALARWRVGDMTIAPDVFIPGAERTGLIGDLTHLVLDQACSQIAAWDLEGSRTDFTVAVNISPQQVVDRAFPDEVLAALARHGVSPLRLVLEITESALLTDLEAARDVTSRLNASGIRLSLDDFGVGYSSLTHLSQIPLQSLKIDRVFISGLGRDEGQSRFIHAFLRFGADLGLDVIAEGVERLEQLELLREFGCQRVQGYLLGRPAKAATWTARLKAESSPRSIPSSRDKTDGEAVSATPARQATARA